jgi:O-antigen ligase
MRGSFAAAVPAGVPAAQNIRHRPAHLAVDPIVRWTFYVFVMSIPFEYPPRSIPVEVHTITGSIFLLTALLQPKVCFRKPPRAFWWLAVYLFVYLTLMVLYSKDIPNAVIFFFNMLQAAFLFWVSYNLLRFDAIVKTTFLSFAISTTALASLLIMGIGTTVYHSESEGDRVTVLGQDPNTVAANMALGLITLIGLSYGLQANKLRYRLIFWPMMALIAVCLVMTGSRGGMVGLGIGILAFTLKRGNVGKMLRNFIIVLSAIGIAGWIAINTEPMKSRYNKSVKRGDLAGRQYIFPAATAMIKEKPILGWGPINQQYELYNRTKHLEFGSKSKKRTTKHSHNLVLEVLTSTGLAGGIPLFICIGLCVWGGWKARAGIYGILPFALTLSILTVNMTVPLQAAKQTWLLFAYALVAGCYSISNNRVKPNHIRLIQQNLTTGNTGSTGKSIICQIPRAPRG